MKRFHSGVLTLLLLYAVVVGLQFFIGAESLYALLLAPLIVLRSVYWRVGLNRLLAIILFAGVPIVLRRRSRLYLRQLLHRLKAWLGRIGAAIVRVWKHLPVWLRAVLGVAIIAVIMATAMLSGVVLWLIAFLPFVAKTTFGLVIIRFLAHTAAARGVREIAPILWQAMPSRIRNWAERRYRHLWWWTMRRIVRNRKRLTRRFRKRADVETTEE